MVPALVFLFLFNFGENKYAIPVFYAETSELPQETCPEVQAPYKVPDFSFRNLSTQLLETSARWEGSPTLIALYPPGCTDCAAEVALRRTYQTIERGAALKLLALRLGEGDTTRIGADRRWQEIELAEPTKEVLQCALLFSPAETPYGVEPNQLVLLDSQRRIRGYYQATDRKEVDRLIQEIQILNKE